MEKETLEQVVARLDSQIPLVRVELNKMNTKADKIDADQRRTMMLFEDTEGKFKLVLDAYIGINMKIEHLEADVEDIKSEIKDIKTLMKEGFDFLAQKIDVLAKRMDGLEAGINP